MIYLIISNSYHLLDEEINKIFKSLDDVEIIDYNKSSIAEIIEQCGYISLFNDEKKIIVKNSVFFASKPIKELELLEKYLENPNPNTTIIFTVNDKIDERKKSVRIIKNKYKYINIKPLNYKEINNKLVEIAKKNKYKLSLTDANYITTASLNNVDIAVLELNKVFLYYQKPTEIKKDVLENIISHSLDDNNFKFVDAVIQKNVETAMNYIKNFKLFKVEPLSVLNLLTREYRIMLITKDFYKKGYSSKTIAIKLELPDWKVENVIRTIYSYSKEELENKIIELAELDYKLKTSQIDKYLGLEMLVLKC